MNTTPEQYQQFVATTAIFPDNAGIVYTSLAMMGEAGEIAEKVKKAIRRQQSTHNAHIMGDMSEHDRELLIKEAGDVLWYVTAFLGEIGSTLQEALDKNVEKLSDRHDRGVLNGSGDER